LVCWRRAWRTIWFAIGGSQEQTGSLRKVENNHEKSQKEKISHERFGILVLSEIIL